MAALRLRAAALIAAVTTLGHFGSCGHTIAGAESAAAYAISLDDTGVATLDVGAIVEVDDCADVEVVTRLTTNTATASARFADATTLGALRCDGPCAPNWTIEVRGAPRSTVTVDVSYRAQCTDCDATRFTIYPSR